MTVAEKMKAERLSLGLTQKEMARKLGLKHHSQISNWEKGLNGPGKAVIPALSALFQRPAEFFLDCTDEDVATAPRKETSG